MAELFYNYPPVANTSGLATEATLLAMSAKLPATLGQTTMAGSLSVAIASNQSAVPVSVASLPLPTGAATEATLANVEANTTSMDTTLSSISGNTANIETSVASIDTKTPALGQAFMAASVPVAIASNQSTLPVSAASLPLPTGAATEATLSSINTKTPALGQAAMAASSPVVIASDQSAVPVSAASLPLPTGAATEVTLAAMSAKLPAALGQLAMAASLSVAIASDQSTIPVSAASLPLPTGAATEATLAALNGKVANNFGAATGAVRTASQIGNATGAADFGSGAISAQTLRAVLATDQPTIPVSAASLPLPTGAATEATLAAMSAKLPAALGQTTMAGSVSVAIASNQSNVPVTASNLPATVDTNLGTPGASTVRVAAMLGVGSTAVSASNPVPSVQKGKTAVTRSRHDYSGGTVTTAAYTQLVASLGADVTEIEIFDSSGETLVIATGAAASEVDQVYVFPGGNGRIPLAIASGTRVSIKAVSANASVGENTINYYG
jgi:hypothetical protein